tara:strand:- start:101 stop:1291 length:1191 start_codon:yes stop_codon:yes gene_type:complete
MKKLLIILLFLPLIFSTCKKEEIEEVLPCLCENSTNSILIPRVNVEEYKDKNDNRNFADLRNDLEKVERIERYQISYFPLLVSGKSAFISGNDIICDNGSDAQVKVYFSEATPPFIFSYSINGISQPSIQTTVNPYIINTKKEGVYTLLSFSDINGPGSINGSAIVTVLESPTALFATVSDTLSVLYPYVHLYDISIGNIVAWTWNFGDNTPNDYTSSLYHVFKDSVGIYQLSLIVVDDMGCSDTTSKNIWIFDNYWMYIPNAFTPNSDGLNDKFYISYHGIREETFTFNVYNRTSNLVYSTNNIQDLNLENGWDGKHQITENNLSTGVYTYEVYYQDFDGRQHQENGKISLIRDISNLSNDFECYPQGVSNCAFGDMIDRKRGFIYPTQEDINNW